MGEFFRRQWPLLPGAVAEAKRDVIAEPIVFQQQFQPRRVRRAIHRIRIAIAQDVIRPFSDDTVVTHVADEMGQVVVVDQFRIPENPRLLAKQFLYFAPMLLDLCPELLAGIEERQRVVIRFIQKFHATGAGKLLKRFDHFRDVHLALLEDRPGH